MCENLIAELEEVVGTNWIDRLGGYPELNGKLQKLANGEKLTASEMAAIQGVVKRLKAAKLNRQQNDARKLEFRRQIEHIDADAKVENVFDNTYGGLLAAFTFPGSSGLCIASYEVEKGELAFYMDNKNAEAWVARGHQAPNTPTAEMINDFKAAIEDNVRPSR